MLEWLKELFVGKPPPTTIAAATFVSVNPILPSHAPLARLVEQAMVDAIKEAHKAGINDPVEIKRRMMQARERVKKEHLP